MTTTTANEPGVASDDRSHHLAHGSAERRQDHHRVRAGGRLREEGHLVEVLDGDEIREFISAGLGFSREDRHTNVQRIGFLAELLARNGVKALVPVIAPYADSREAVRKRHRRAGRRTSRCMWRLRSRCAPYAM